MAQLKTIEIVCMMNLLNGWVSEPSCAWGGTAADEGGPQAAVGVDELIIRVVTLVSYSRSCVRC